MYVSGEISDSKEREVWAAGVWGSALLTGYVAGVDDLPADSQVTEAAVVRYSAAVVHTPSDKYQTIVIVGRRQSDQG